MAADNGPQTAVEEVDYSELLKERKLYGVVAEFEQPDDLLHAVQSVRQQGYSQLDAFTPFPVHGLDDALGESRSKLGYFIACCGAVGLTFGFLLQWWTGAIDYPLIINGKPFFTLESSIPVMFECTILFSAFGAVFGMIGFNGLPRFYHPIFKYKEFHRATDDGFLLAIKSSDPAFEVGKATALLSSLGARKVEAIEE